MCHSEEHAPALNCCSIPVSAATGTQDGPGVAVYNKERHLGLCRFNTNKQAVLPARRRSIKGFTGVLVLFLFLATGNIAAQDKAIDKKEFFTDDRLIEMTIVADFKKLISEKLKKDYKQNFIPATITCLFPDSTKVTAAIEVRARGKFRREECYLPPVMLNFKTPGAGVLKKFGKLKLVMPCGSQPHDEQLVLKEYLVYKIYNLLTEKSFRVRLAKVECQEVNTTKKPRIFHAFFIEDIDDVGKRNSCEEVQSIRFHTERTNRDQTTLVSLFQYMIGNTDWAIPIYQNIKLVRNKKDSSMPPFVIPYDFDHSGLVNAEYASPPPELPITSVRERLYRGFPRTMEELQAALQIFRIQRESMNALIMNLEPLTKSNKKEMISFLDEFFELTEKEKDVKNIFIRNARVE